MRTRTRKKRRKLNEIRIPKKVLIPSSIIIGIILFCVFFAIMNLGSKRILSGISINGLSVSGMTLEEAKAYINEVMQDKIHNGIKFTHNGQEFIFELNEINIDYSIDKQIQEAYKIGRTGNIVKDNFVILYMLWSKKQFDFDITYDEDLLKRQIDYLEIQLPDRAVDNKYYVEGNNVIIVKGLDGVVLDKDAIQNIIKEEFEDLNIVVPIEIPVIYKPVESLSIDKIHNEIYKKAENAYYTVDPFKIYPHTVGVDFAIDNEEIEARLAIEDTDYFIPLKYTEPEITLDNLNIDAFPDLLSQYDTPYDVTNQNKKNNLEIAMNKINGIILRPGETFSYNKTLGARTIENGYKEAPIYSNGKIVNGLGGGICQGSTTLYNAVVLADLKVVERQNHMFIPSYVKPGCDATVVYGSIDFKFTNTRDYPIKIVSSANNGVARVSIYGIYKEKEYTIQIETKTLEITPYNTVYINDSSLNKDEEQVIQSGQNGVKVEAYKVTKYGSLEISRELLSVDTYRPLQETVLKGI